MAQIKPIGEAVAPYYDDGQCVIYHGDCREILPSLGPADVVLTDPPYGAAKAVWDQKFPVEWFAHVGDLVPLMGLMPGIVNLPAVPLTMGRLRYRWTLAAYLSNGMTRGPVGFGNWIACMIYAAEGSSIYRTDQDCRMFAVGREEKPDHPSPKPLNVTTWFLALLGGDLVLDPFMGSGTTLRAAKDLGRRAIGIEIEERYCEIAAKRLAQEVLPLETSA